MDRAGGAAVDAGAGVLSRLAGWLRARLRGGPGAVDRVADAPDSPSRMKELAAQIDSQAAADVPAITQTAWGNQNVQIADTTGSSVSVSYGDKPKPSPQG